MSAIEVIRERGDGWIYADETLTYASATTFTVAGDRTVRYSKGTRLKLTQSTVKYFVVTLSSFSAGVTTVTFTGGTDYTLANATISDPFYSYATNPQGYPTYFNYTPTWGGFSTAPALGGGMCRFSVVGGVCFYMAHFNTSGTSNATSLTASIPVTNASFGQYPVTRIQDNGTYSFGMCEVTSVLTFFKDGSGTGFTASGSKNAWWGVSYII